jgi:hypothetical protein
MEGMDDLLTEADDNFHPAASDDWYWHETCFFYFYIPERKTGCWMYNYIRPNIGISGGGCWVWDDRTHFHMEAPYYANYSALKLPEERDLRDFRFPSGVTVKRLEPISAYHLTFKDREAIEVDVTWTAIQKPWVRAEGDPPKASHWEQFGHVEGHLTVHGDRMEVDCLAMRDRTWAPRNEKWKIGGGSAYASAAVSGDLNFLATGGQDLHGFFTQDGDRRAIVSGTRKVERHPEHGYVTRIELDATDSTGRKLHAVGVPVSRLAMPLPGVHAVVWTSTVAWNINGQDCWGEDQDPWPLNQWSQQRREGKAGKAI